MHDVLIGAEIVPPPPSVSGFLLPNINYVWRYFYPLSSVRQSKVSKRDTAGYDILMPYLLARGFSPTLRAYAVFRICCSPLANAYYLASFESLPFLFPADWDPGWQRRVVTKSRKAALSRRRRLLPC